MRTYQFVTATAFIRSLLPAALLSFGLTLAGCSAGNPPVEAATAQDHDQHDNGHDEHGEEGSAGELTLTQAQLASLDIKTVVVEEAPTGATRKFPGRVVPVPDQEAMVTSLISGRIERVLANEGDRVRRGEPVAVVTGAGLGDHIAELRHRRADLDRQQRLTERGVGVRKNLVTARTAYAAARQHLRAIGFSLKEIEALATGKEDAEGMYLRTPIGGVVLKRDATQGGPVEPGQVLFHVASLSPIWVEADVYERDLDLVREGMKVRVTAATSEEQVYEGAIRQVLSQVHQERRVATVRIQLSNTGEQLKPGMFATVDVLSAGDEQPALPVDAILADGTSSYVIVAENDSSFRRQDIDAPIDGAGWVAVPELPVGARVVTAGAFQIQSAMAGVEAGHAH